MSSARLAITLIGLGLSLPAWATAQVAAHVDLGLGGAPTTGPASTARWSVAPTVRLSGARLRLEAAGEYRELNPSGNGLVGYARGSWFLNLARPLRLEVTAEGQGHEQSRDPFRGAWESGLRLHLANSGQGLWLGSQLGGNRFGGTVRWEGAAWRRWGRFSVQLRGWQLRALNQFRQTSPFDTLTPLDSLRRQLRVTTDLGAWFRWAPERFELAASTGWRIGAAEPGGSPGGLLDGGTGQSSKVRVRTTQWWAAEGTWWFSHRAGIHTAIGRYPTDLALGTTAGNFFRLGIRAAIGASRAPPITRSSESPFIARRSEDRVEFLLRAPRAGRVELMADFTDWAAVDMAPAGAGRWRLELPVAAGVHHINVRYDRGAWRAPPGTRAVRDEFDQETGVVVVD